MRSVSVPDASSHVCCYAHVRAEFNYAHEHGVDKDAGYMLECIVELYALERTYMKSGLCEDEMTKVRHDLRTKEIQIRLRSRLDTLPAFSIRHGES